MKIIETNKKSVEYILINKGLGEKKYKFFFIGDAEYVLKSFLAENLVKYHWLGLNYFFYKEYGWRPNYKLNSTKAKDARMIGTIFETMYEMCKEVFLNKNLIKYEIFYDDGFIWFGRCCRDFTIHMLMDDFARSTDKNKRDLIDEWKRKLRVLKSLEISDYKNFSTIEYNPFIKYGDELMGLINLIEMSYRLSEIKPNFKYYWQKFLKAIDDYITYINDDKHIYEYSIEHDSVIANSVNTIQVSTRQTKGGQNKKSEITIDWIK